MKVQILGTGCAKCMQLYAAAEQAVASTGVAAELEKVEDIQEIVRLGVMTTPALVIDGRIQSAGKVLTPAEVAKLLRPES